MKILVIGEKFSDNLGDGVICDSVAYLIKQKYVHAKITFADISGREGFNTSIIKSSSYNRRKIQLTKKIIAKAIGFLGVDINYFKFRRRSKSIMNYVNNICASNYDLAIFAGGQLLKDTFVFPIKAFVEKLREKNTPIIFNAVGVGTIDSPKMRNILRESLLSQNVRWISTRDDINWINQLIENKKKIIRTSDPAVWSANVYTANKKENDVVGLGIMYVNDMRLKELYRFWTDIVSKLNEKKIKWKMFCNGSVNDYLFAKDLLISLGYSGIELEKRLVKRPVSPEELVNIISNFKSIISFRLHSHIIAYSLDIPGVALVWDPKVRFFYKSLNMDYRCKSIDESSEDILNTLYRSESEGYNQELKKNFMLQSAGCLSSMMEDCIKQSSNLERKEDE